jgi:hypothetical protein
MTNLIKPTDGDSTEFYTVEETGESGMSQTGLAILCGVSRQAIIELEKTLVSKAPSKWLEPFIGKDLTLVSNESDLPLTVNGKPVGNLRIYKAGVCARIIQHYAFRANGSEVAQYSLDQFTEMGINQWIQGITGWKQEPTRSYIPYWYQRLTLFTAKTRVPDGWWSVFEELAKLMRELEGLGYVLPDVSPTTGKRITPDISIGQMFCKHMRAQGHDVDGEIQKYLHYYPDGREIFANIYPDKWLQDFRLWFNSVWKKDRLVDYLGSRDPNALTPISRLLGLPEGEDD